MRVPTRDEVNVYNSLDEITACEHFCGKTLEEADALFRENGLHYCQDLMWMGSKAFTFYLQAAINYLQSEASREDSDMINCLKGVVEYRKNEEAFDSARDRVRSMVDYVINHYDKFDVDIAIYGDVLGAFRQLQNELK